MAENAGPIVMTCGHSQRFNISPPVPGQQVYCRQCKDYRDVIATQRAITIRCQDCRYGRKGGVGGETDLTTRDADVIASRHAMKKPGHRVEVIDSHGATKSHIYPGSGSTSDGGTLEGTG